MKLIKKIILTLSIITLFTPSIYAYSDYIYASGKNIGIKVNLDGVLVVGTYEINNKKVNNLKIGDKIISINGTKVNNITEMTNLLKEEENATIKYIRNNKQYETTIDLVLDNGIKKTGLYVKDMISGIGTLTYIDPETNMYGALGHEIIEKNTMEIADINNGEIFSSTITGIKKSDFGIAGEKNATYDTSNIYGDIKKNTISGIFGKYDKDYNGKLYKVANINDIKLGNAKILTVIENNDIKEYDIEINKLISGNTKNILFTIIDKELLDKTGGIIQGMSGSPIIQDDIIVGAVTHVVLEDPTKGYGIYITNMLEESEK